MANVVLMKELALDFKGEYSTPLFNNNPDASNFENATYNLDDPFVSKYLTEYQALEKAGVATDGMKVTLQRSFPDNEAYAKYADLEPFALTGKGSMSVVDAENQMITASALSKAFNGFLDLGALYWNINFLHSNQQVGVCLPIFKTKKGYILKSEVVDNSLYVVSDLNNNNSLYPILMQTIKSGQIKDYSIGGRVSQDGIKRIIDKSGNRLDVISDLEIFEVTICEKGVNPEAGFSLVKGGLSKTSTEEPNLLEELNLQMILDSI